MDCPSSLSPALRAVVALNNMAVDLLVQNACYQDAAIILIDALHILQRSHQGLLKQTEVDETVQLASRACLQSRLSPTTIRVQDLTQSMNSKPSAEALQVIRICDVQTINFHSTEVQTTVLIHNLGVANLLIIMTSQMGLPPASLRVHLQQAISFLELATTTWERLTNDDPLFLRQITYYKRATLRALLQAVPDAPEVQQHFDYVQLTVDAIDESMLDVLEPSQLAAAA